MKYLPYVLFFLTLIWVYEASSSESKGLKCEFIEITQGVDVPMFIQRCENSEVICYVTSGISCKFKEEK